MTMHKVKSADEISSALTPYQRDSVDWIKKQGCGLLAFSPGVGKTLTTLATIHELGLKRVLVIAPASVCGVWPQEIEKWLGKDYSTTILRGTPKTRDKQYRAWREHGLDGFAIMSYETVRSDVDTLKEMSWDAIVLDETIKIQTPTSKTVKAVMKLTAPVRIALNGTPISNGWSDIWATFEWLERGSLYGNFYTFRAIHAVMSPYVQGMITGWRETEKIKRRTAHLIKRITKQEAIKDLPAMIEQVMPFELSAVELKTYNEIKKELILRLPDENVPIENALVELVRLRQTTNGLFHFPELGESKSSKLELAIELITQVANAGAKIIVFSSYKQTIEELERRCSKEFHKAGYKTRMITGDVDQELRSVHVKDFMEKSEVVALLGTDAMATGLNLQEASYVMNIDLPYSYAKYEQRIGRAWRMGQKQQVTVWNLQATGTVDEKIAKILAKKVSLSDDFTGDGVRVGLSREDLTDLVN